jgi:hypothetical protein
MHTPRLLLTGTLSPPGGHARLPVRLAGPDVGYQWTASGRRPPTNGSSRLKPAPTTTTSTREPLHPGDAGLRV